MNEWFGSLFGGQSKVEEAAKLYKSAANSYKMAKKWAPAGKVKRRNEGMNEWINEWMNEWMNEWLGALFGGQSKVEEAAELYKSAANSYKMAKKCAPAGKVWMKVNEWNT